MQQPFKMEVGVLGGSGLLRMLFEIAAFPFVVAALFAYGLLASAAHLIAMPGLFLWEKFEETRSTTGFKPCSQKEVK
jgi:hypothetical protein